MGSMCSGSPTCAAPLFSDVFSCSKSGNVCLIDNDHVIISSLSVTLVLLVMSLPLTTRTPTTQEATTADLIQYGQRVDPEIHAGGEKKKKKKDKEKIKRQT